MKISEDLPFPVSEIFIRQIVLDDTTNVTLFGYLPQEDGILTNWDFVCNIKILTEILLHAGTEGDTLIEIISGHLSQKMEDCILIDVENLFGKPLQIMEFVFAMYKPKSLDENGNEIAEEDPFYMIDNIQTLSDFLDNGLRTAPVEILTPEERLEELITGLIVSYKHYLHLVEVGVETINARQDAALSNESLFEFAELYYRIRVQ